MNTNQKISKKQESPWSFRPDEDVRKLVQAAISATGMDRSELVNRALRKCGAKAIDEVFAESRKREQAWVAAKADPSLALPAGPIDEAATEALRAAVESLPARPESAAPIGGALRQARSARKPKASRQ